MTYMTCMTKAALNLIKGKGGRSKEDIESQFRKYKGITRWVTLCGSEDRQFAVNIMSLGKDMRPDMMVTCKDCIAILKEHGL